MADIKAEIIATVEQFTQAVESLDLSRILEFFEDGMMMFSPLPNYPKRLDGRAAVGEQFKTIIDLVKQSGNPLKLATEDVTVEDLGGAALVTLHLKQPGPVHRRTFVLRRGPRGWRFVHIHASVATSQP